MTWTAILTACKKTGFWLLVLCLWSGMAYLGFSASPSKMSGEWKQIQRTLTRAEEWNSYKIEETVTGDGQLQLAVNGNVSHGAKQAHFQVTMNLSQSSRFNFETYLTGEKIFIHNNDPDRWVQLDYAHPTAGELSAMTSPMAFWKVLLTYAGSVEKVEQGEVVQYRVLLRPFEELDHGIAFASKKGEWTVRIDRRSGDLREMSLSLSEPEKVLNKFHSVEYHARFNAVNQTVPTELPAQALQAEKLK